MRGILGNLNWATREGMPQGAGEASLLASTMPNPLVKDVQEANAALRRLNQQDVPIPIRPIPLDRLKLVTFWLGLAKHLDYDHRKRDVLNREIQITAIMKEPESTIQELLAVTDAKQLYDNLNREQYTGAEKRSALEICVIRDSLQSLGGACRWVPHEENPVDCMTQIKRNSVRLLQMMKSACFRLIGEKDEMQYRKEYREATGQRNPRPSNQFLPSGKTISLRRV